MNGSTPTEIRDAKAEDCATRKREMVSVWRDKKLPNQLVKIGPPRKGTLTYVVLPSPP